MKNATSRTSNLDLMLFLKEMDGRLERLETCMGNLTARTSFETSLLKNSSSKLDFLLDLFSQSVAKETVAKEAVAKETVAVETVVIETGAGTSSDGEGLKIACTEILVNKKMDCEVTRADASDIDTVHHHKPSISDLNALSLPFQPKTYASICVQNSHEPSVSHPQPVCSSEVAPRQVTNCDVENNNTNDDHAKAGLYFKDSGTDRLKTIAMEHMSEKHSKHLSELPAAHNKQPTTGPANSDDDWRVDEEDLLRAADIAMTTNRLNGSTTTLTAMAATSLGELFSNVSRLTKWSVDEEVVDDGSKRSACGKPLAGEASHKKKVASTCRICKGNHRTRLCSSAVVKKKKTETKDADSGVTTVTEPIHCGAFDWTIRPHRPLTISLVFHSGVFYTRERGYRMQLKAEIDRLHGDAYFAVRIMKGAFDSDLEWPFTGRVKISIGKEFPDTFEFPTATAMEGGDLLCPDGYWKCADGGVLHRPHRLRETVVSGFHGPFNISQYMQQKYIKLVCIVKDGID